MPVKHTTKHHRIHLRCTAILIVASWIIGVGIATIFAQEIRTPVAPNAPRVNGPSVFGVRPGAPFLYKIAATGAGTIQYSVDGLPAGLHVDAATGMITGTLTTAGQYTVTLRAANSLGSSEKQFRIKVGDAIALTPPMGWNSWNCYGESVSAAKVQQNAAALVSTGLINHGWSYVTTDLGWAGQRGGSYNALQGNAKFPDVQALCNSIHGLNLKAGIYSTPWIQTYATNPYVASPGESADNPQGTYVAGPGQQRIGAYTFENNDAQQWAAWGIDYMKYDWDGMQLAETARMETALRNCGRDIVYSLSNSTPFGNIATLSQHANLWRNNEAPDIIDTWSSMAGNGFAKDKWAPYQKPGHYNDPDMLVVGRVGWGATQHQTNLTADEQYTHITLWSLLGAPLLLGCDLTQLDAFTLNLLTNDEVLAVDQDPLCLQATCANAAGNARVYVKNLEDGSKAVGLFNLGNTPLNVTANWSDLGLSDVQMVRDLWRQHNLGDFDGSFSFSVAPHGAELFQMTIPVPEPGSFLLLLTGALCLARFQHRRRRGTKKGSRM
jgi:alpha-galactosidase